jgi:hypothetical protein
MAISLQNTISVIEKVIDFAKEKGKERLEFLRSREKTLGDVFEVAIFFLDEVMDNHPEIDEIDVVWNVIRFSEKIKDEVNLLYEVLNEAKEEVYNYELKK